MRTQTCYAWLSLILLTCRPGLGRAQGDSGFDVKAFARKMEDRFEACPRREVVARFDRKHHKQVWQKQAEGPPTSIFVDVRRNDSLLYPYLVVVEFSVPRTFGPERQSKEDAQNDSQLEPKLGELLTLRGRNNYLVGKDDIRIKSREFLPTKLDGAVATWRERSLSPDACWDQIGMK